MAIIRRKKPYSKYVYPDGHGNLVVKTPVASNNWPTEFRKRLSKYWISAGRVLSKQLFVEQYVETGWSSKIYCLNNCEVKMYYMYDDIARPAGNVIVNAVVLEKIKTGEKIEINHPEIPFRVLQIYEFITDVQIGGVPSTKKLK